MIIERGKWLVEFQQDYTQFFEKCNWYTYRFCEISFENDAMMGAYDATFCVLGLSFRWRWEHTETEFKRQLDESVAIIKKEAEELDNVREEHD